MLSIFSNLKHQADKAGAWNDILFGFMSDGYNFPSNPACDSKNVETASFHGWPGLKGMGAVLAFQHGTGCLGQTQGTFSGRKPHVKSTAFQLSDNFFMFEFGGHMFIDLPQNRQPWHQVAAKFRDGIPRQFAP
jgi:hypothetical protein